ncbi:MAG: dethiobiotin synthase [Bacteroidetes bacterium]|nr:dethiobiotin synthase [Bacteroidota bacterium]
MNNVIAIAGIHTNIGKTIASAVLAEALQADYWKPVQAGDLDNRDSLVVQRLLSNNKSQVHKEAVMLSQPMSPHAAAAIDGIDIDHTKFHLPFTDNTLLLETAGGILSPLSNTFTMADLIQFLKLPAILVTQNYLGSINHTLLTIEVLRNRNIPVIGVIVNGESNKSSEAYIEQYGKMPIIARIPRFDILNKEAVKECAENIKGSLVQHMEYVQY